MSIETLNNKKIDRICEVRGLPYRYDVCSKDYNMLRSDADKYIYVGKGMIAEINGKRYTYKQEKHFWIRKPQK